MKTYTLVNDYTGDVLTFTDLYDLCKYAKDNIQLHPERAFGEMNRRVYRITQPWNYMVDIIDILNTDL